MNTENMQAPQNSTPSAVRRLWDRLVAFFVPEDLTLPDGKRDRSYLAWCFLIPFSFMLILYVIDGVYPFGDRSVLILDLNGQYVGFYEALRSWIYGDGSLLYSFARTLGGEFMGIYAYYIASPLSYIVALFPAANMTEALFFIMVLKTGLCGLTFGIYLHRQRYSGSLETVFFSAMYALCAYGVVMQHNSMWIDNLILLPLVTLGVEEVIKFRRFRLFVISLTVAILSNFYIGFMTCIYVLIYFFYYFYAFNGSGQSNPRGERQQYLRALLRMGLYSALAVAMSAIILLTVTYSLSFGKNEFSVPNYSPYLRFNPIEFFAKLLPGSYDTVEPQGLPFVYCGVLTLILVPLYFCNRRIPRSERISGGVLLSVFYLSFSINTIDILWHGGQAPNWLNYRYSFFFCFLLLVLASRAFARLQDVSVRAIAGTGIALMALLAVTAAAGLSYFPLISALIVGGVLILLTLLLVAIRRTDKQARRSFLALLAAAVLTETFLTGNYHLYMLHMDVGTVSRDHYASYHAAMEPVIGWVERQDDSFYRMETTNHRVTNDVMELGYRGVTNSTSTLNYKTIRFLNRMGLLATSHWSEYKGSTYALDSLLGIRYVITKGYTSPGEVYTPIKRATEYTVYKNPNALPIAYTVSDGVLTYDFEKTVAPLGQMNALTGAMLGDDRTLYRPLFITSTSYENLERNDISVDGHNYVELLSDVYLENREAIDSGSMRVGDDGITAPEAQITFTVRASRDGSIYFYTPTDYPNEVAVYANGLYVGNLFGYTGDHLKNLGSFTAGETVEVTLKMEKCVFFYYICDEPLFYYEDTEAVTDTMTSLAAGGITLTDWSEDYFAGRMTGSADRPVALTTIPYDAGWIVTVDGEEIETYEALDALLAFDLAPGEHTVTMRYCPRSYVLGATVSLTALGLFLLLNLWEIALRRRWIRLRAGSLTDRISRVFLDVDSESIEEPNYLSDEEMDKAEAERLARAEAARARRAARRGEALPTDADAAKEGTPAEASQDAATECGSTDTAATAVDDGPGSDNAQEDGDRG